MMFVINPYMAEGLNCLNRKDLTGKKFGHLTVLEMLWHYNGNKKTYTRCICDCGNETIRVADHLYRGDNISCGCMRDEIMKNTFRTDITGQKFGRLTVLEILWEYKRTKARCLCDCGKEIIVSKSDVATGHTKSCGCLQSEVAAEVNMLDQTGFISTYGVKILNRHSINKNGQYLWKCRCGLCGNEFLAIPANVKSGDITSCGCSLKSSGERFVESVLNQNKLIYSTQYKFDECKDKRHLRFDFAVFDNLGSIRFLIEYDGRQHFNSVPLWGGVNSLQDRKRKDILKDAFCKKNGILLLRLPYTLTDEEIIKAITNIINP